jgi:hypothetical protein
VINVPPHPLVSSADHTSSGSFAATRPSTSFQCSFQEDGPSTSRVTTVDSTYTSFYT